ncbi:MAG: ice-binding family protein [Chloroflexota bacterium]
MYKSTKRALSAVVIVGVVLAVLFSPSYPVAAYSSPSPVDLGTAEPFAVLGGTAVTLTTSTITGDVGAPSGFYTNTGSTITGTVHVGDATYDAAIIDFIAAWDAVDALGADEALVGTLAGEVLSPGVYTFDSSAKAGTLHLNSSDPDAVWIFKSAELYLETGASFEVVFDDQGEPRNVFWWTDSYAALTDSTFIGTILAGTYITATNESSVGRALAKTAVTLTDHTISVPPAAPPASPTVGGGAYHVNKGMVLGTWLILPIIVIGGSVLVLRQRRTLRRQ